jgi:hypothetical protein
MILYYIRIGGIDWHINDVVVTALFNSGTPLAQVKMNNCLNLKCNALVLKNSDNFKKVDRVESDEL